MNEIERPSTPDTTSPNPKPTTGQTRPATSSEFEAEVARRAREEASARRRLRTALGVAIVLHAFMLAVHLPERSRALPPPPEEPELFVVQELRFKEPPPEEPPPPPPPPEREPEPPQPDARSVPIPDPEPERMPDPPPAPEPPPLPEIDFEPVPRVEPAPRVEVPAPPVEQIVEVPPAPPEPTGPIHVTGDVRAPVKVRGPEPVYSDQARRARVEGVVVIQAIIDRQGNVTQVEVLRDLPMGLGRAAEQAVKQWKFEPATLDGRPVEVYFNLTVNFRLQ
jgi:periplasmic protein TonB